MKICCNIHHATYIDILYKLVILRWQRKELECETEYDKVCNDKKDGYKGK